MGYCYTRDAGLFALADGMGGHPEGEVASQLALQTLAALFQREAKPRWPTRCASCRTPSSPATTNCCATPPTGR
jgi:serine/threonine protein phosphatase PrpC